MVSGNPSKAVTGTGLGLEFDNIATMSATKVDISSNATLLSLNVTGSTIPTNGIYSPAANQLGFATNSTQRGLVNATGNWTLNAPSSGGALTVNLLDGSGVKFATTGTSDYLWFSNATDGNGFIVYNGSTMNFQTANAQRVAINGTGNVTISAPSSGIPLTINLLLGQPGLLITGDGATNYLAHLISTSVTNGRNGIEFINSGAVTKSWVIGNDVDSGSSANFEIRDISRNVVPLLIGTNGNVTITAPASGVGLTVGGVSGTHSTKIADSATASFNAGFLEIPQNSQAGNYTFVLADSGKQIYHSSASAHTFTIPANASVAYPIGTAITVVNQTGGGVLTLAITTDTLIWSPSGTTGSRSIAANGTATALKITATSWLLTGSGIT